jgi:ABC-type protease/lipase transport system fused ATPase/permease subunit
MFDFFRSAFRGLFGLCVVLAIVGLFIGVIFAFGFHPLLGISAIVGGIVVLIFSFGLISTIIATAKTSVI